jgi:hypothetical protein
MEYFAYTIENALKIYGAHDQTLKINLKEHNNFGITDISEQDLEKILYTGQNPAPDH